MKKQERIQEHLDNLSDLAQENTRDYDDGTEFNIYDLKELMAKELTAIEVIQQEEEELFTDELNIISEVISILSLYNNAINFIPKIEDIPEGGLPSYYRGILDLTGNIFEKNQGLIKDLGSIISSLLEFNDNPVKYDQEKELALDEVALTDWEMNQIDSNTGVWLLE